MIFFTLAVCKAVYRCGRGISHNIGHPLLSIGYESKFFGPECYQFRIRGAKITGVVVKIFCWYFQPGR